MQNNNTRNGLLALGVLGGFLIWRNRFAIQRQLESMGIKTPFIDDTLADTAKSVASKVTGKMERGATIAESHMNRRVGNY